MIRAATQEADFQRCYLQMQVQQTQSQLGLMIASAVITNKVMGDTTAEFSAVFETPSRPVVQSLMTATVKSVGTATGRPTGAFVQRVAARHVDQLLNAAVAATAAKNLTGADPQVRPWVAMGSAFDFGTAYGNAITDIVGAALSPCNPVTAR